MSLIKDGFCSKILGEFDSRLAQIKKCQLPLSTSLNNLKLGISEVVTWSPQEELDKFTKSVDDNHSNLLPDLSDFDELASLANQCVFTKFNITLATPSVLAGSLSNSLKDNASSLLGDLSVGINAEFNVTNLLGDCKSGLKGFKLDIVIPEMDQLLNCLSEICGEDVSSRVDELQDFLSQNNLNDSGELDMDVTLGLEGLDAVQISAVKSVLDTVETVEENINTIVDLGVEKLKNLVPF